MLFKKKNKKDLEVTNPFENVEEYSNLENESVVEIIDNSMVPNESFVEITDNSIVPNESFVEITDNSIVPNESFVEMDSDTRSEEYFESTTTSDINLAPTSVIEENQESNLNKEINPDFESKVDFKDMSVDDLIQDVKVEDYCQNCGCKLEEDQEVCNICGTKVIN